MDDSCAVCAESLDWVAYGACGHKDVCSTCVARLRFICDDRRCCICKTESDIVFVTKALGDYTKTISDFSLFPSEAREGKVGQYWYHEGMQAFFDDLDHYKMIKEMCRLSCSVCDRMEDQPDDASRRRAKFKNIEQLKGHLFHKHKLIMCSLCLEGRKVFICEQKLYTRSQLTQHINTGDSEVDGTESDRGGFMGHPTCEFCLTPFYGDNELYTHMSTEHYTCHICQRQHPGQYEYYKNYDDLEIHFGRDHFLCEDEACLAKKFIVFQSEAELKRHNTLEHGGRMSRSKRSAALQIPTSFRYRRSSEQDNRRGRGRMFRRDQTDDELSFAIEASLEASSATPSNNRTLSVADHGDEADIEALFPPLESLSTSDSELSSKYREAVSQSSRTLGESSFPPLSGASGGIPQNSHPDVLPRKTMAAHLRPSNRNTNASSSGPSWPVASRTSAQPAPSRTPSQPAAGWTSAQSAASWTPPQTAANRTPAQPPATSRIPTQPAISPSQDWPSINGASGLSRPRTDVGSASSNHPSSVQSRLPSVINSSFAGSLLSSRTSGSMSRISHSSSAPNLSDHGTLDSSETNFPPVSASKPRKSVAIDKSAVEVNDVQTANKSLVEQMRASLGYDEEKFNAFKEISGEYRQGSMDAIAYLAYVEQFGLSHLVLELAKLLPNAEKQRELIEAHNVMMRHSDPVDNIWGKGIRVKETKGSKKGKGKLGDSSGNNRTSGNNRSKDNLAENVINTVKELQSSYRSTDQEVEVLSKGEYRTDRGKSKAVVYDAQVDVSTKPRNQINSSSASGEVNRNSGNGNGKNKQQKKTSKFHRVRLGDGSIEALLDIKHTDSEPDPSPSLNEGESLPVRGVWRNGGGQKLVSLTSRDRKN